MTPRTKIDPHSRIPLLIRRDTLAFPKLMTHLLVYRASSQKTIETAMLKGRKVIVLGRRNIENRDFSNTDLYQIGTLAKISGTLKMPDGSVNVLLEGKQRVMVEDVSEDEEVYTARFTPIKESRAGTKSAQTLMRAVLAMFEKTVRLSSNIGDEAYVGAINTTNPGALADLIVNYLPVPVNEQQEILELLDPTKRLQRLSKLLAKEVEVLELQTNIQSEVQQEVDKTQREHLLREHIRVVQRQLGEGDQNQKESRGLRNQVETMSLPEEISTKVSEELDRLETIPTMSPESTVLRNYIEWLINIPWTKETDENLDMSHAQAVLNKNHYGLQKVKERILEFIAVKQLSNGTIKMPILCFVGAPGVGKTSLGASIAEALGRKFARLSLGGIRDEAEIRGHRRTYIGALPGRIIQTMRRAGVRNPIFMFDELDKVGMDFRGDPSSALLEILDPEQNDAFSDHYLEVPYSLSNVLFIATANTLDGVLPALRDRLEIIEIPGYTEEEKLQITRDFLIDKQCTENAIAKGSLKFTDQAIRKITREYTREAGVRSLDRSIATICRKVARRIADGEDPLLNITPKRIVSFLGEPIFTWGTAEEVDEVGVATGLARTEAGGDVLAIEVTIMDGKGDLTLTGSLGEVMKESAQAALSYARARNLTPVTSDNLFKNKDIHIHVPAGAVPKDGPSAGVTIATALVSALSGQPVRKEVAMTGEVTLRGRVLEVGGIKEKILAAHRAGIKTMVLPQKNYRDLKEIPSKVKKTLLFKPVADMDEVLSIALLPPNRR